VSRDPDADFDRDQEDAFHDAAFEDEGEPPLQTPEDGEDLDASEGERGTVPLGYQGLGRGTTPAEEERGDSLDERLLREQPEEPERPPAESGMQLAEVEDAGRPDTEGSLLGRGAGQPADPEGDELSADDELSAEEAAIHEIGEP
jgi:hypothetical protein